MPVKDKKPEKMVHIKKTCQNGGNDKIMPFFIEPKYILA
jgi:hypothetical protein